MRKVLVLAFLWICLNGCSAQVQKTTNEFRSTLTEFRILPTEYRIPAGHEITLTVVNQGMQDHDWTLLKDPPSEPFSEKDEANVLFRVTMRAGESQSVKFKSPSSPGEYSLASSIPGDLEKGMIARLLVVQPGY